MSESAPKTVMVVDDDPSARTFVAGALRAEGYRAVVVPDGAAALDLLGSAELPDLIILDIEMPGMDGYEVLQRLRDNPATAGVPLMFLTVQDTAEDQKRGLSEGVLDYISKEVLTPDKVGILTYRVRNFFAWQENERLRGVLATIVSANHEINNPLMVIQGSADLIRIKGHLAAHPDGLKALQRITDACHSIAGVLGRISGLHTWARADYLEGVEMLDLTAAGSEPAGAGQAEGERRRDG